MQEIPRKNPRDYSYLFLVVVLAGLVVTVVGLMMATTRSQLIRSNLQNPASFHRGIVSSAG